MKEVIQQLRSARRVGAPLVVIQTPDQPATLRAIDELAKAEECGLWHWDILRGVKAVGDKGKQLLDLATGGDAAVFDDASQVKNPVDLLEAAPKFPGDLFVVVDNFHLCLEPLEVRQGLCNLRDEFKKNGRCLVMLAPALVPPAEIAQDTLVLTEPLPKADVLGDIVKRVHRNAGLAEPAAEVLNKAVDATRGLSAFAAEQVVAMSLKKSGVDLSALWERKRSMIEQTPGLGVWRGGETFADLGGLANLKDFLGAVGKGNAAPRAVVFIDEIEKSIGGAGQALDSGVSAGLLQALLVAMQDRNATGIIAVGPPGTGKSAIAKAFGNEYNVPTIAFDLGAMKGGIVGDSEKNVRRALDVVEAVSDGQAFYIATCNGISVLPPELRRRFTLGTWFVDLPGTDEQEAIWAIYLKKYGLDPKQPRPGAAAWTGAEIKACCDIAWRLKRSIVEASDFVVPVALAAGAQIKKLRSEADGKYLSANKKGTYKAVVVSEADAPAVAGGERRIKLDS